MKKLFFTIVLMMVAIVTNAQWKVTSVDKQDSPLVKLLQILEMEDRVLVYGTVTNDVDTITKLNLDRKITVVKNNMNYKLKNSVNLPVKDEAEPRMLYLSELDEKVNFVMEFEKFDVSDGFDIIENNSKHNRYMLNFYGIHIEKIDAKEVIDTERFLDCSNTIYGYYYENNRRHNYFIKNGLMVEYFDKWYDSDWLLYFNIVNNSDHGVMFDREKLTAAVFDKDGKSLKFTRYTPDSYDSFIDRDLQNQAANRTGASETSDRNRALDKAKRESNDILTQIGLSALQAINNKAQDNRIRKYLDEHPRTIPKALRSTSIRSGESVYGFIPYKVPRKCAKFYFCLKIDDASFWEVYSF